MSWTVSPAPLPSPPSHTFHVVRLHPCFVFLWFRRPPDPDLARGDGGPPDHLLRGQRGDQLGAALSLCGEPRVGVFF